MKKMRQKYYNKLIINEYFKKYDNLVKYIASKIKIRGDIIKREDIVQWGYLGLLKAIKKYNPNLNKSFTPFASKIILTYIIKNIIPYENNLFSMPEEYNNIKGKEIKGKKMSEKEKRKLKNINKTVSYFEDNLEDVNSNVLNILENKINKEKILNILNSMNEKERQIIEHGLLANYLGNKKRSYTELQKKFGIKNINKINKKFINKVKLLLK